MSYGKSIFQKYLLTILFVVMAGCTTTVVSPDASKEQAVKDHIRLGLSYIREGNRQLARQHIERALEINKRSPAAHHAMALLLQTELENKLAEQEFKKALSYDRDFTRARNNYAVFLVNQDRYEDAYDQFRIASEDIGYRNRHQVFYSLGVVADKLGRDEEAEKAWIKAIALAPRYGLPHLELAELKVKQGNFKEARKYLEAFDKLAQPEARSLWLAVKIADHFGDKDAVASKGLALTKLFPNSDETRQYRAWLNNDAKD